MNMFMGGSTFLVCHKQMLLALALPTTGHGLGGTECHIPGYITNHAEWKMEIVQVVKCCLSQQRLKI